MSVVLIPLAGYGGPFGDFATRATNNYYQAVAEQVKLAAERQGFSGKITLAAYAVDRENPLTGSVSLQGMPGSEQQDVDSFKAQCRGAHCIFIRGGRWIDGVPGRGGQVKTPALLSSAIGAHSLIEKTLLKLGHRDPFSYTLLDPVVSNDLKWVFLSLPPGLERHEKEIQHRRNALMMRNDQSGMERENDSYMQTAIEILIDPGAARRKLERVARGMYEASVIEMNENDQVSRSATQSLSLAEAAPRLSESFGVQAARAGSEAMAQPWSPAAEPPPSSQIVGVSVSVEGANNPLERGSVPSREEESQKKVEARGCCC